MSRKFTDMHLIAALLSYDFTPLEVDSTDKNRQKYRFPSDIEKRVYVLEGNVPRVVYLNATGVEKAYSDEKLLFPPRYHHVMRTTKYAIVSKKHEDEEDELDD